MIGIVAIFVLVLAVAWIARIARTRGASPWLFGSLAAAGYLVFPSVVAASLQGLFVQPSVATVAAQIFIGMSGWLWVGAIALYVSRVPGREKIQPRGRWSCGSCGWLNDAASLKCDACAIPYSEPVSATEAKTRDEHV